MVGKIVDDGDAADFRAHLQSPLDALEGRKRLLNRLFADSLTRRQRSRGCGIQSVVLAGQAHFKLSPQRAAAPDLPAGLAVLMAQVLDAPIGFRCKAITLDTAQCAGHALRHVGAAVVGHNRAAPRHQVHQPIEGRLDRCQVHVNVGVVKLDVGQDQRVGKVMQELGAFVEEGGVVLIALDDEGARGPQLKTRAEVLCHAADEERRLQRRILRGCELVDPRQHAGGGGLAVRARDDQRFAAHQELLAQQGGHRGEGNPLIEYALDFWIASGERVADDDEIRGWFEIGFGVRFQNGDAEPAQQVAHGRIGSLVGAGDAMSPQLEQPGQRRHGGAADATEVNVPGRQED